MRGTCHLSILKSLTEDVDRSGEWKKRVSERIAELENLLYRANVHVNLPRGQAIRFDVSNAAELQAAFDAATPGTAKKIINITAQHIETDRWLVIGGKHGNTAIDTGHDIEVHGNGCVITGRGLTIERNCKRILVHNLAIYPGSSAIKPGITKASIPDAVTIVGYSKLFFRPERKEPATDIWFDHCAFGFSGDMNFQSEGKRVAVTNCFNFYGLHHPDSKDRGHSKAFYFSGNEFLVKANDRLPVLFTNNGVAFCDDRAILIHGGVDAFIASNWFCNIRLGMQISDWHVKDGIPRVTVINNEFTTGMIRKSDRQPFSRSRVATIAFGRLKNSLLHFSNNDVDGFKYHDARSIWELERSIFNHQKYFGGKHAHTRTPEANRCYHHQPVVSDQYDGHSQHFGTIPHDPIQMHVHREMKKNRIDPNFEFTLLKSESNFFKN